MIKKTCDECNYSENLMTFEIKSKMSEFFQIKSLFNIIWRNWKNKILYKIQNRFFKLKKFNINFSMINQRTKSYPIPFLKSLQTRNKLSPINHSLYIIKFTWLIALISFIFMKYVDCTTLYYFNIYGTS